MILFLNFVSYSMQGKKSFTPKLFVNFRLDEQIPDDNFYKILKDKLDLSFVYKDTASVYSHTGRPGIDPVVFFKMVLVGYLENVCTDRALERLFHLRLDLLYFIDHDLGERVPDHSTICKTRKRIPRKVFDNVFNYILKLCVETGLVQGDTQSIDSAYITANASLDRMQEIKLIDRDHDEYLREVFDQDLPVEFSTEEKVARVNKLQQDLEMHRNHRERKFKDKNPNRKNKRRFLSNATHLSKTDPDARIAKKSSKPRMLCYSSTMSVDTKNNVITHIAAEHSSKKDSQLLMRNLNRTSARLSEFGIEIKSVLADAGYSSGENYKMLEQQGVEAFIPLHGTYETHRKGFKYDARRNAFTCAHGQIIKPTYTKFADGRPRAVYRSKKKVCDSCPLRNGCVNKKGIKEISSTPYKREYERMIKRLKSKQGKISYALRMHTVEPVFGSLQHYYGLRRMNVRGRNNANKVMLMSAAAFNLKKWIKAVLKNDLKELLLMLFALRDFMKPHRIKKYNFVFLST